MAADVDAPEDPQQLLLVLGLGLPEGLQLDEQVLVLQVSAAGGWGGRAGSEAAPPASLPPTGTHTALSRARGLQVAAVARGSRPLRSAPRPSGQEARVLTLAGTDGGAVPRGARKGGQALLWVLEGGTKAAPEASPRPLRAGVGLWPERGAVRSPSPAQARPQPGQRAAPSAPSRPLAAAGVAPVAPAGAPTAGVAPRPPPWGWRPHPGAWSWQGLGWASQLHGFLDVHLNLNFR